MIIYSVKEEFRIIIYLLSFGTSILFLYDLLLELIKHKKSYIQFLYKILFSVLLIYGTYLFSFHLKNGYLPQYSIILVFIGMFIYLYFFHKKIKLIFDLVFKKLRYCFSKIKKFILPFRIFKKTFLGFKKKMLKKNIKTLYK